MKLITKNNIAFLVSIIAIGLIFSLFTITPAKAQTTEELQQQIQNLLAQIAALQGGTTMGSSGVSGIPSSFQFTRDLTVGSTGQDTMYLQKFLNNQGKLVASTGAGSPGNESTYFGNLTKTALAAYQASQGISPAVGYFGPITRANVNTKLATTSGNPSGGTGSLPVGCQPGYIFNTITGQPCTTSSSGTGSTGGILQGGAGDITEAKFISALNNEEVGEGQKDVEVAGLEIEASQGSDLEIIAVTLDFDLTSGQTGNTRFDRYADEVSILLDGKRVARLEASKFTKDNNYTRSVSLDRGAVIKADRSAELVVAVSGIRNLDSQDAGNEWTVTFSSIRFQDAQGAIISENSQGDIGDARAFTFEEFASAAGIELRVTYGDKNINDARTIAVDEDDDTDGVEFFSFNLEARGNSDITIEDLPIFWTAVGANVGQIINSAELWIDGKRVGSENVSISATTGTTTFDRIDYTIDAGDKVEVIVKVDINDLDSNFTEGNTLRAEFTSTQYNSSSFDAEDERGNTLTSTDKRGAASTDAHTFYANGIEAKFVSQSVQEVTVDGDDNDYVNLSIVFDITAFGQNIYIPNTLTAVATSTGSTAGAPTTAQGMGYLVQLNSHAELASTSISAIVNSTTAKEKVNSYLIDEGETERFTLKITIQNAATNVLDGKSIRAILTGINFASTDTATGESVYTSNLQNTFRTSYGYIAN